MRDVEEEKMEMESEIGNSNPSIIHSNVINGRFSIQRRFGNDTGIRKQVYLVYDLKFNALRVLKVFTEGEL